MQTEVKETVRKIDSLPFTKGLLSTEQKKKLGLDLFTKFNVNPVDGAKIEGDIRFDNGTKELTIVTKGLNSHPSPEMEARRVHSGTEVVMSHFFAGDFYQFILDWVEGVVSKHNVEDVAIATFKSEIDYNKGKPVLWVSLNVFNKSLNIVGHGKKDIPCKLAKKGKNV